MSAIIPFDFNAGATTTRRRERSINLDVMTHAAGFPSISIKGKVFAIVKGDERTPLVRELDGDVVPVPSLQVAVVRANVKGRVFYAKSYVEGDSDNAKPACFSHDGVAPDATAEAPQSRNCQLCPHAVWGSKVSADGQGGKGTACTVVTRLAVVVPRDLVEQDEPVRYLLRVPAGSRANFSEAVKQADKAGKDYNEVVMKISFDPEAPSPKLVFKPVGLLDDNAFAKSEAMFNDDLTVDICGRPSVRPVERVDQPALPPASAPAPALAMDDDAPAPAPAPRPRAQAPKPPVLTEDDLAAFPPAPAPAAKPAARAPAPAPAPAAKQQDTSAKANELLGGLASMLGMTDD